MSKPVTGLISFGSSPGPDSTGNLDTNYNLLSAALNDLGTFGNFVQDTSGAANAIVCASAAGLTASLVAGLPLQIKVANTNTGATTVALNALPSTPLLNPDGSQVQAGQLRAGGLYPVEFDGTNFQLLGGASSVAIGVYANVLSYGADPTNTADSTTAINNAIAAVSAQGGGKVFFPTGTYKVTGTLTFVSFVLLEGSFGATINFTTAGTAISTAATGVVIRAGIHNLTLSALSAAVVLQLNSIYECSFQNIWCITNSLTNVVWNFGINTTGTTNPAGNYNSAFNHFLNINQDTTTGGSGCGSFIVMNGPDNAHVITLNTFTNINAELVNVVGLDLQQWCDSNTWAGDCHVFLSSPTTASGIALRLGSAGQGCYAQTFETLAVDTFGAPTTDNRVGIYVGANACKYIQIALFEFGPDVPSQAFGGTLANLQSCTINQAPRGTTIYSSVHFIGTNFGVGNFAANNVGVNVTNVGQISGTNQFGFFQQTAGFNAGAPVQAASYGCNPGLASFGTAYSVNNLQGYYCGPAALGTNASTPIVDSFYAADQSVGNTSNYGYRTVQNNHTATDRAFYAAGTAPSQFNAASAPPAGGAANVALLMSSTAGFGIYIGSGAPTLSAAQGSLYLRTDGSSGTTRAYINTNGSTTWTAIDTVA
jgi:pectate lyase-like protein